MTAAVVAAAIVQALLAAPSPAPSPAPAREAGRYLAAAYSVLPGLVYKTAGGAPLRVDVYRPRAAAAPAPTLVFFHGGGWIRGNKEEAVLSLVPWLERGFAAVNVQYRLGEQAAAPAAVEDALCAVRWVFANAGRHGFDTGRIVLSGVSAGGHLALAAAMAPASAGLARACPVWPAEHATWSSPPPAWDPQPAAVVNWFGITDVAEMLDGPGARSYAVEWLGAQADREALARRISPLALVRPGVPPVITVHGDADKAVPYAHATRLHSALDRAGVRNRLVTIPGGGHGGFGPAEADRAYDAIGAFLDEVFNRRSPTPPPGTAR